MLTLALSIAMASGTGDAALGGSCLAILIGNSDYQELSDLPTVENDLKRMSELAQRVKGCDPDDVILRENVTAHQMDELFGFRISC